MNINNDIGTTYLITNKKMTLVAILGITLGMSIYIFMNCMVVGFDKTSNDSIFKNTAHIRVFRDDVVSRPLAPDITKKAVIINPKVVPASNTIINPDEVVSLAKKHPDVVNVTPQVTTTMFYNIGKTQVPGIATGILPNEADQMFNIRSTIVEGSFEKLQSNLNAIAIGSGVAEKLSLAIDDNINISSPKGVSKNMKIVAIFKTNNSIVDKSKSYINLSTAQQLLRENNTYVTDINVNVKDPENCDQISKDLKVLTGYSSESWKQANETMVAGFRMRRIVITFISYTILIVAGFGIYNILNMTVSQKINDISILKAIGFRGKDVVRIFLTQAMSIGLMGVVSGCILAVILITLLKKVYIGGDIGYFPIDYELTKFLQGIGVGLIISFFAGYLPARKAAQVDPVSIFRR
ncbi:MAG: ABC transporter permease [Saprospiraceae bacterium]|nr:ABC transporter permease [Saprospiraceae bacterium]MBK6565658.1 ABC transporter permease [Saprospiraceae bacterium]MBK6785831.1 ABC transporter permease [Saprospiraceae bacterium]MBK7525491.1 ABC transporter permease [Saprospiraceae bacterium]MBK8082070.1 ABC transporter permease [Saprospiraceae bacterium]